MKITMKQIEDLKDIDTYFWDDFYFLNNGNFILIEKEPFVEKSLKEILQMITDGVLYCSF